MILRCICFALAGLVSFAHADVQVTSPQAGDIITGLNLQVQWQDSGTLPPISQLANYQLFLCAGGNAESDYVPNGSTIAAGRRLTRRPDSIGNTCFGGIIRDRELDHGSIDLRSRR